MWEESAAVPASFFQLHSWVMAFHSIFHRSPSVTGDGPSVFSPPCTYIVEIAWLGFCVFGVAATAACPHRVGGAPATGSLIGFNSIHLYDSLRSVSSRTSCQTSLRVPAASLPPNRKYGPWTWSASVCDSRGSGQGGPPGPGDGSVSAASQWPALVIA